MVRKLIDSFLQTYQNVQAILFAQRSRKGGAIYETFAACPEAE